MNEPMHDEITGENTVSIVNNMLSRRRSIRLWTVVGTLLFAAAVAFMILHLGSAEKKPLTIDGPVGPGRGVGPQSALPLEPGAAGSAAPAEPALPHAPRGPAGTMVEVEVHLEQKGQLWLDGRLLGPETDRTLRLPPGKYNFTVRSPERTLIQTLSVAPGDTSYRLTFGQKVRIQREVHTRP